MKSRINILAVDDRADGLVAIEAILSDERYHILKARSGAEALALVKEYDFAVILLDVQMPVMDGFETAVKIKSLPHCSHTPIIFVTAISKEDVYVFRGYQSGAVDYIFKPVDENILKSKVSVFADLYEKSKKIEEQARKIKESAMHERYLRLAQLEVESLKRFQNLANSIPHAVWRSKADGTMDYFNRGWIEYTGLTVEQSLGSGWQSVFHPEDLRNFLKTWMRYLGSPEDFEVECRMKNAKGEWSWNLVRAIAECRAPGEVLAWHGTCTDIHERKMFEEKLIRAQKEADAANIAKTNFLANMSHEIRTPLNSILGFTEIMLGGEFSPQDMHRNLVTIKKNGVSLLKIIDEILDISKVETGHLEIQKVETDLEHLLIDIYSLLEIQAQEKGLLFNFKCDTPIPKKIFTDPTRLRQILVNLVGNSLKFTKEGHVELFVSWTASPDSSEEGLLRCEIRDTGIGIKADDAKKLFQPFVQVDSSKTRQFGGTGLGLALSLRLARALDGNVYIQESAEGQGSTFVIEIKARKTHASHSIEQLNLSRREVEIPVSTLKDALHEARVLVVDDSVDNRNLITHFLKAAGAHVECAEDGLEGVQKALESDYQIILMDIQMPRMDGYQATAKLREQGYKKPIIALTAHALKQERVTSLNAGCDDHLTKPIDRRTLIDQVSRFVQINAPHHLN